MQAFEGVFDLLEGLHPAAQALLGGLFTWGITALGAALGIWFKSSRRVLDLMLGFAAGVMVAASFFSLLLPAIDLVEGGGVPLGLLQPLIGFLSGSLFMWGMDKVLPHLHPGLKESEAEGYRTGLSSAWLMMLAMTLHNVPEGLAVGVSFGSGADLKVSLLLTFAIGLQNFPEGFAVSGPMRGAGYSRSFSFGMGQLSALVEPLAAVLGAYFAMTFSAVLPFSLAFAAGAMMYVVVEEVIPESHYFGNADESTLSTLAGFALMMFLDTALG